MINPDDSIKNLIHSGRERERFMALNWEGSFEAYLDLVEANPLICRNAFQRMLDMIVSAHALDDLVPSDPDALKVGKSR